MEEVYTASESIEHSVFVDPERVNLTTSTREADGRKMAAYDELTDALALTAIDVTLSLAEIYAG